MNEVYAWLSEFLLLFIHVRQIFIVNLIIYSFAITINMKRKHELWLSVIWDSAAQFYEGSHSLCLQ